MEDREVLLRLIEDYPNLINSLEEVTDLPNWSNDLRRAIGSIYSGDHYYVTENLKFLIFYLFNTRGFFIHVTKTRGGFSLQLCYTKGDFKSMKGAITVFLWYSSSDNNEQAIREELLKGIMGDFKPSIPKEKEMLQEVIYNCKVISEEVKMWTLPW